MTTPYAPRSYRAATGQADEQSFQVVLEESDLWISCLKNTPPDLPEQALACLAEVRRVLKAWISLHPDFASSLIPLPPSPEAPPLIQDMLRAGQDMQVGPMAAVAGTVAEAVCRRLRRFSSECIVENGGDIFICSSKERKVALLPDPENASMLGLKLSAGLFPLAVCSSSATIGHSLSFGRGELITVLSQNAALADAAATSLCNRLQEPKDVEKVVKIAENHPEILGIFAQCGERLGLWGDMELVVL